MASANDNQRERARRLLALEAAAPATDGAALTAAARVFDKLHAHLASLVGVVGVELLLVRSAKLAGGDFEGVGPAEMLQGAASVRERLASLEPAVGAESAVALFATFLQLLSTFIGERLTLQLLHRGWPTLDETAPVEKPNE